MTTTDTAVLAETAPTAQGARVISHWIDGAEHASSSGRTAPVFNPATGSVTARVALADDAEIASAIASAQRGFAVWSGFSIAKRQTVLFAFRELLNARKGELAEIITAEHGKVVSDAMGEIARGQEVVELATGFPHLIKGAFSENVSSGIDVYSTKQPLGVVGIISPFNFPAMVPMWFFPIAIAAGNAVILKPSEKDPSAALWMAQLWKEAGLPDGVFTVLQGDKLAVDGLLTSPVVQSISFVGSTPIAQYIYETASKHGKRVQALGGAKNHMLVLPDADLDLVADQAVNAGYGAAGERCMAISVVLAVEPVADDLIGKIAERIGRLRIGNGAGVDGVEPDMGPLITEVHRDKVASYVDIAEQDGAKIVVDGRGCTVDGLEDGFFFGPTLIDDIPTTSRAYTEEIFGPVLSIVRVESYDEGLDLINSGEFGNGTAIFTNDGGAARRFQNEVQVGMIGINVPIPVPVAYHSFGGWKKSLFGDAKAYGVHGFDFFTREKAITSRWLDPATHGGINLGFPRTTDRGMDTIDPRWFHRRRDLARDGWESVVDETTPGWRHTGIRVAELAENDVLTLPETGVERIFVPLAGGFTVTHVEGDETTTTRLSGRASVFAGPTDVLYLAAGATAVLTGVGRIAVATSPTDVVKPTRHIPAATTPVELRGGGAASRQVHNLGTPAALDAARLIVCEVITPASNWSSYPPHKHDESIPGHESRLEEIYYFESAPTRGASGGTAASAFGMFSAYSSPAGEIEVDATVRTGDIALIPYGYHGPAVAAPGYDLYYLNVMAGPDPERVWLISDDPAHAWVRDAWPAEGIDPRLPLTDDESEQR